MTLASYLRDVLQVSEDSIKRHKQKENDHDNLLTDPTFAHYTSLPAFAHYTSLHKLAHVQVIKHNNVFLAEIPGRSINQRDPKIQELKKNLKEEKRG